MFAARILIVDDDAEIRHLLGEQLRDLGHEAMYAADGVHALAQVQRERPDLILLDLRLPGGDGFTVLERLQRIPALASTPVIVFSGSSQPEAEGQALLLGAREYVRKSLTGNGLNDAIARVLGRDAPERPALTKLPGAPSEAGAEQLPPAPTLRLAERHRA